MILETVLIWIAAAILAVVFSPVIFLFSIILVSLALFLLLIATFSAFMVLSSIFTAIVWPFHKFAQLFTKKTT